jgi:hypothetical protein
MIATIRGSMNFRPMIGSCGRQGAGTAEPVSFESDRIDPMGGWQPIETAPKDGTVIDLLFRGQCQIYGLQIFRRLLVVDRTGRTVSGRFAWFLPTDALDAAS